MDIRVRESKVMDGIDDIDKVCVPAVGDLGARLGVVNVLAECIFLPAVSW